MLFNGNHFAVHVFNLNIVSSFAVHDDFIHSIRLSLDIRDYNAVPLISGLSNTTV